MGTENSVIPLSLAVDLLDVGVAAQRAEAFWREPVPGGAAGVDDGVVVVEQPVREEALAQIQPDTLDRVQLGRVRRQRHQGDVAGNPQRAGAVPSGLVQHHHGVLVSVALGGEAFQEQAHRFGRDLRQHERGALARGGLDGGEDVGPGEAPVAQTRRALPLQPPAVAGAAFLADSGLVLEPERDPLAGMGCGRVIERALEPFFANAACA